MDTLLLLALYEKEMGDDIKHFNRVVLLNVWKKELGTSLSFCSPASYFLRSHLCFDYSIWSSLAPEASVAFALCSSQKQHAT